MPQVTHVEWPAGDADRLQAFLEGLFGWQFDSPMEGMDYRMARTADNEGAAVYPGEKRGLMVYYDVDDIDAHVVKVRDSGGEAEDKMPVPSMGWFSQCRTPRATPSGSGRRTRPRPCRRARTRPSPSGRSRRSALSPSRPARRGATRRSGCWSRF